MILRAALLLALCAPGLAQAAVYKCTGADGKPSYQSLPCKEGEGGKVDIKPAPAIAAMNPVDQAWVRDTKPNFNSACTQGLAVANARNGGVLNSDQVNQVCNCATQRYYEGIPVSTLRGWQQNGDRDSMQERLTPITQSCGNDVLAGQTFRGSIGGGQNIGNGKPDSGNGAAKKGPALVDEESILHDLR